MILTSFRFKAFIIFLSCLLYTYINGQETYALKGQVYVEEGNASNISVKIFNKGHQLPAVPVNSSGAFRTFLHWNQLYYIYFSKPGYVSKIIEFSTTIPDHINRQRIEPYNLKVRLFKLFEGVDTVFFKNPVAKIKYDKNLGDFEYDMDYSLSVKYKIDAMRKNNVDRIENQQLSKKPPVENNKKPTSKVVTSNEFKSNADRLVRPIKSQYDKKEQAKSEVENIMPPLKAHYPPGRTIETFDLVNRTIVRVVIMRRGIRDVYFRVKHDWGATFYFHDESPLNYRSINRKTYERETGTDESIGTDLSN